MTAVSTVLTQLETYIINPALLVVFTAGLFLFMYGLVEFMWNLNRGESRTSVGTNHMLWGVVGMTIMLSFYGIISLLSNTFGLGIDPHNPSSYNPNTSN